MSRDSQERKTIMINLPHTKVLYLCWRLLPFFYLMSHCKAQTCSAISGSDFTFIDISPRPSANDPLTGGDTLGARCSELSNQPNIVLCLPRSLLPPLIDGDLGPEGANYTNTMVHAWHRSTGTVYITYTLDTSTEIRHMDLYFYSITSMGIGLPSVTVYRGSTVVGYHIFGNDDITQEDNMRRQILLSLRSTSSSRSYTLQFDFDNTDVDWLVLSETRLCTVPIQDMVPTDSPSLLPPSSPVRTSADNINLSCTVAGEGRFSWQWTDPDGNPPSAVIISNVTRTSIATFTNIRGTGGGTERNLTFTCTATYNHLVSGVERNSVSQETTVVVQAVTTPPPPTTIPTQCDGSGCSTPTTPDVTTITTQREVCSFSSTSVVLASVITAITTALLTTVIFVLVQIAVCKCHPKFTPGRAETGNSAGKGEGQEYEQMDTGEGGVAVSDPSYMEVGAAEGKAFELKHNEAYGTHTRK